MTTKTYDVIQVSDTLAVVADRDAIVEKEDYFLDYYVTGKPGNIRKCVKKEGKKIYDNDITYFESSKFIDKIICTIGERIEGLPLVVIQEDDKEIEKLGRQRAIERKWNPDSLETRRVAKEIILAFEAGYKKAQEKGTYTLQDIKDAFQDGQKDAADESCLYWRDADDYAQSLHKPKFPVHLELELEGYVPDRMSFEIKERLVISPDSKGGIINPVKIYWNDTN